jgi:plasmid maintenance system antidote protein VapI
MTMTQFKEKFKKALIDKGIKKKDVYECLGVHQMTLDRRLNNPKTFTIAEAEKIKSKFNINILEL